MFPFKIVIFSLNHPNLSGGKTTTLKTFKMNPSFFILPTSRAGGFTKHYLISFIIHERAGPVFNAVKVSISYPNLG